MSRLLMVGCGWMGRPYLRRAHERGMEVAVLDSAEGLAWARDALGPRAKGYTTVGGGDEAWQDSASRALRDGPVDAIVAFSEAHVVTAAMLADELRLPGPGLRAALTSRNKLMQRELFARHGLPQPAFHLARDVGDALTWASGGYPLVAKPLSGMGSHDVQIVTHEPELRSWCEEREAGVPFLVEEYVSGPEYSVEALIHRGDVVFWGITQKTTTPPPYCVELAHQFPAECDAGERASAEGVLAGVARALGMGSGIIHLELRLGRDGPRIMEVAVRTPGDYIMDVVEAATGVDMYDSVIALACGQRPVIKSLAGDVAAVWFPTPAPGVVTAVEGADRVAKLDGVVNVEIDVEAGATVKPLRSSMDRVGMVITRAADRGRLGSLLETVRGELRIDVRPASGGDGA
ncbi:MAG: hypothetical protein JWO67_6132 [Streptosporangiaceae bacterium]|nr:hypothetical protein [Streptosporangiaceae bacterium]